MAVRIFDLSINERVEKGEGYIRICLIKNRRRTPVRLRSPRLHIDGVLLSNSNVLSVDMYFVLSASLSN